ncbi:4-hydroxy-2-ketovalerate aldolase [Campylobacter coli]|nr:4-hydroxy-2-ketovalerate aldolase [Campylobacter coli]EAJ9108567.1 4-hydroxy-2-ketovalerate aldolase [Campylobacter jejuni]EAI2374530.1 4-hydroxy-2-ketovalerate aldolase [Campylobacter coli]EAI2577522.1 4-hydroxy-2-ketovalerate aldolase [Campylobacter coli]EAI5423338.1 4-hydroxy-2-ketovalerate aldolase [Campylobacter coli]
MNKIKILDCTLRDGAHVNKGKFGKENILLILQKLAEANIDLIEVGFLQNAIFDKDLSIFDSIGYIDEVLEEINKVKSSFGVMLRTDRCDFEKIKKTKNIDFIRMALYKEHLQDIKKYTSKAKDLGYSVYLNPIGVTKYSLEEIKNILQELVVLHPEGISIVDTFGSLTNEEFSKFLLLFDEVIPSDIEIGIHLHENLSSSLSLALQAIKILSHRNIIIDSSVLGMGRIPGNLPTELLVSHLQNSRYHIDSLYSLIDIIREYKKINEWGYNPIYVHSAVINIDRTYPEYFFEQGFSTYDNIKLQKLVKANGYGEKFNSAYAQEIISKYEI